MRRPCEWNPTTGRPVVTGEASHAEATLLVGTADSGEWHLCKACAGLPMFGFLKRKPLGKVEVKP